MMKILETAFGILLGLGLFNLVMRLLKLPGRFWYYE